MVADRDQAVGVAELDPDSAADRLGRSLDRRPVEGRACEGQLDSSLAAEPVAVAGREIAEDAVVDPVVLGADVDRLGNLDR